MAIAQRLAPVKAPVFTRTRRPVWRGGTGARGVGSGSTGCKWCDMARFYHKGNARTHLSTSIDAATQDKARQLFAGL